jgi:uncharacterized protein
VGTAARATQRKNCAWKQAAAKPQLRGGMTKKQLRGFAAMNPEQQRAIAEWGQAAHALGTAHEFTVEEASQAGKKGGLITSRDRAHTTRIARKAGMPHGGKEKAGSDGHRAFFARCPCSPLRKAI